MALSSDEAYGLIGQIEEVRHEMALAQAALIAFARGKLGQPGQPNTIDVLRISAAAALASQAAQRLVQEANDIGGAFGG